MLRALVIGLGRVGSRFDEEPRRAGPWSHAGAYLALADRFELSGACDPDPTNAAAFRRRCPQVPVFAGVEEAMLARPDVVSICTPHGTHGRVLRSVLAAGRPKVVWCEKPLATGLAEGREMVRVCERSGATLVVSQVRRWLPLWRRVKALVDEGAVGEPTCVRVAMPNRLWSVQSHAVDLALMLGGPVRAVRALPVPALAEDGEPAFAALLAFAGGAYGIVQATGRKRDLIVEAEVTGSEGRLHAREDAGTIARERFAASPRYDGYRQLAEATVETAATFAGFSPFTAIAAEIAAHAGEAGWTPACGGDDALAAQAVLDALAATDAQSHVA